MLVLLALLSCAETSKDPAEDTTEVSAGTESSTGSTESNDTSASTGSTETDAASSSADSSASSSSPSDSSAVIDDPSETVEACLIYLSSRSLTAETGIYETIPNDNLYWTYTAEKKDNYFSTGQTDSETPLNTDDDGNALIGLPTDAFGEFSVGTWLFKFYAYEPTAGTKDSYDFTGTDDEGNTVYYSVGDKYYDGSGNEETTNLTTTDNTVSVNVQLVEAEGDTGCIVVYGVTIKDTSGENEISTLTGSDTTYAVITLESDGETISEITDSGIAVMATEEKDGLYLYYTTTDEDGEEATSTDLPTGYYDVTVTFYVDGSEFASGSAEDVLVRANLTTTVTGDTLEVTVDAELDDDVNVTYDTYEVSTADELISYLAVDGATVVLTSDITDLDTTTISNDTTIDLSGYTISSSSTAFTVESGASLTLIGDDDSELTSSVTSSYLFSLSSGASLTISGGSYTSTGLYSQVIYVGSGSDTTTIALEDVSISSTNSIISGDVIRASSGTLDISVSGESELSSSSTGSNVLYSSGGTVNLVLEDSSTLTSSSSGSVVYSNGGTVNVVLEDSSALTSSSTGNPIYNNSGTINFTVKDSAAISSANSYAVYNNTGTMTGSVEGSAVITSSSSNAVYNNSGTLSLTVSESGAVSSESTSAIYNNSGTLTVVMSGGTISGGTYSIYDTSTSTDVAVSITGGTVSGDLYSTNTGITLEPSDSFTYDSDTSTYTYSAASE